MENQVVVSERKKILINLLLIVLLSAVLLIISLSFSSAYIEIDMFKSYIKSFKLLGLNFLPIFLLMVFIWLVTNKLWASFTFTGLLIFLGGLANRTKLTYRDDPVIFSDILLINEAGMMLEKYKLPLTLRIGLIFIGILVLGLILKKAFNYRLGSWKTRLSLFMVFFLIGFGIFKGFYFKEGLYNSVGNIDLINRWIESERHQSKGFIYPFVYSAKDLMDDKLEGYDPKLAKEKLGNYTYKDIGQGEKVHVISIMLEAYNDFSQFENIGLNTDVYRYFHKLQEESAHGKVLTNVFAGGTIDTERGFLTGYQNQPKYNRDTNSFVWYLDEQGYKTEAMHPITGSFYNRRNVNTYLGFQNFDYMENKYSQVSDDWLRDKDFFDYIIEGYKESKGEGKPYFNFSVTYQNHGPYSKVAYSDTEILERKDTYNEEDYNIINNYLIGIGKTDQALEKLIEHFRQEEEPVVVLLFGDHNPWLGEGNSAYNMVGINIDLGQPQGFKNYYQTPYLIWGNNRAKEISKTGLVGERQTLGPSYLMSQLFEELGWEGNEYMQVLNKMKSKLPVIHRMYYKEDGELKENLSEKGQKMYDVFRNIEYYQARNFNSKEERDLIRDGQF